MFGHRERAPKEMLAALGSDERLVSWALLDGGSAGATTRGLWLPSGQSYRRIGWELIDKAVWRDGVLTVTEAQLVDDLLLRDLPPVPLALVQPRDLPPTVRRRVEASVVRSEVLPVAGGAARFVARRVPGRDGVSWWARLEPGTADTPSVRESVRARRAQLATNWAGVE